MNIVESEIRKAFPSNVFLVFRFITFLLFSQCVPSAVLKCVRDLRVSFQVFIFYFCGCYFKTQRAKFAFSSATCTHDVKMLELFLLGHNVDSALYSTPIVHYEDVVRFPFLMNVPLSLLSLLVVVCVGRNISEACLQLYLIFSLWRLICLSLTLSLSTDIYPNEVAIVLAIFVYSIPGITYIQSPPNYCLP